MTSDAPALALPTTDLAVEHQLALLLAGRCRACAERLPGGAALRGAPCPHCAQPSTTAAAERDFLHGRLAAGSARSLWWAVLAVAAATAIAGWFPILTTVLLGAALVWIRVTIVAPALRLLSPGRRLIARWTIRLTGCAYLAVSLVLLELLTLVPVLGALAKILVSGLQVAFAGWFAQIYLGGQIRREADGKPIGFGEWLLLVAVAVGMLTAAIGAAYALVWIVHALGLAEAAVGGK